MPEERGAAARIIGTILSIIGYLWLAFAVLTWVGAANLLGMSGGLAAGMGSFAVPAIVLIAAGRAIRRRAAPGPEPALTTAPPPVVASPPSTWYQPAPPAPAPAPPAPGPAAPVPPPPAPAPAPRLTEAPAPVPVPAAGSDPTSPEPMADPSATRYEELPLEWVKPRTSGEMVAEARKRWSSKPAGPGESKP